MERDPAGPASLSVWPSAGRRVGWPSWTRKLSIPDDGLGHGTRCLAYPRYQHHPKPVDIDLQRRPPGIRPTPHRVRAAPSRQIPEHHMASVAALRRCLSPQFHLQCHHLSAQTHRLPAVQLSQALPLCVVSDRNDLHHLIPSRGQIPCDGLQSMALSTVGGSSTA